MAIFLDIGKIDESSKGKEREDVASGGSDGPKGSVEPKAPQTNKFVIPVSSPFPILLGRQPR